MTTIIIRIYEYMQRHHRSCLALIVLTTLLFVGALFRMHYQENITDFLPLSGTHQKAMNVYQSVSGANRIFVFIRSPKGTSTTPDLLISKVDQFVQQAAQSAGLSPKAFTKQIDEDRITAVTQFVYSHIPYFLTPSDYQRMERILGSREAMATQLDEDRQMLLFPSGGLLSDNIQRDPLNLFTPVVQRLQQQSTSVHYELYDGYIFTPDLSTAIVMIQSPYGSSETANNGRLLDQLRQVAQKVSAKHDVTIHFTGGPVIAVENAAQIKADSILSVSLSVVLILLLLFFSFRNLRNMALVAVSIIWGWLFAMACLYCVHDHVSVIVIGISSVIIGIAVNYPLHLISHLSHTPNVYKALREIVLPLTIGNVTTVGAFFALVPLKSVALRDLGLFAAFLLIGTIFFVLVFLPHLVKIKASPSHHLFTRLGNVQLDNKRPLVWLVVVLTIVLAVFSFRTSFDTNFAHINYMSEEQQTEMAHLQKMAQEDTTTQTIYVVTDAPTLSEALVKDSAMQQHLQTIAHQAGVKGMSSCYPFLCSQAEQQQRLQRWQAFVSRYEATLTQTLPVLMQEKGFDTQSFGDFFQTIRASYPALKPQSFAPLTSAVFANNLSVDSTENICHLVTTLKVANEQVDTMQHQLQQTINSSSSQTETSYVFHIKELNSEVANNLSDNFNYIGFACGCIVFFFLWFSMGNLELAALSFLPMAVSWIWILGLMGIGDIQFNIVNVILATFIFGQGDDYTIFITEGCQYEYTYGKKLLASYKNSIILSALVMFIGMGTLIFAQHQALRSLAHVTIVGMFSVVLMAYLLPPLVFRWLVYGPNGYRKRPITLRTLFNRHRDELPTELDAICAFVADAYYYKGRSMHRAVKRTLVDKQRLLQSIPTPSYASSPAITVVEHGYGETALVAALLYPQAAIYAEVKDEECQSVVENCGMKIVRNIHVYIHQNPINE